MVGLSVLHPSMPALGSTLLLDRNLTEEKTRYKLSTALYFFLVGSGVCVCLWCIGAVWEICGA